MKRSLRKSIVWGSTLSLYALVITAVVVLLLESDASPGPQTAELISAVSSGQERAASLFNDADRASDFTSILLPLGPGEGRLPGSPAIWTEFLRESHVDSERVNVDGFDGLQAVAELADFSEDAVAEVFVSGAPVQAFRRGRYLLVLNSLGNVQIIDCENLRAPKISGSLPYHLVNQMEMQGDIAYLHLHPLHAQHDTLVIVDLGNPLKPRELSQLRLPEYAASFFFQDHQLVVYASSKGPGGSHVVHMYDFNDDFQPIPHGRAETPRLGNHFVKFGNYLLSSDLRGGLNVVDFNDPLQPVSVATLVFPDLVKRLSRHGDVVFALGDKNHVYAVDLHDPAYPVLSIVVEEANYSAAFMKLGQYSYYFTDNGYLRVFDIPPVAALTESEQWPGSLVGELVPTQTGSGFLLLGDRPRSLPAVVTDVLNLPDKTNVIDTLFWQGFLVMLNDDGLVDFLSKDKKTLQGFTESLKLPSAGRWLTASDDRIYVGGKSGISVIAKSDDGHFVLSGHVEFSGEESWDGLVVQRMLCVAAGKQGVVSFSVKDPDRPSVRPGWTIPRQLEAEVDVRQLGSPGGDRVLVAAGAAGLLSGLIDDGGQLQLDGFFKLPAPLYALAVVGDFCLASTGNDVCVIDIKSRDSMQNLGKIDYPGVAKFAVAAPDFWAGYVPGSGWSVLPVPRLVLPGEIELLHEAQSKIRPEALREQYRLNLFNDHEVVNLPGVLTLSSLPVSRSAGAAHGVQ